MADNYLTFTAFHSAKAFPMSSKSLSLVWKLRLSFLSFKLASSNILMCAKVLVCLHFNNINPERILAFRLKRMLKQEIMRFIILYFPFLFPLNLLGMRSSSKYDLSFTLSQSQYDSFSSKFWIVVLLWKSFFMVMLNSICFYLL